HMAVAVSGMGDRAVNVLAVAVAVGLGASGGGGLPARPPLPAVAAAAAAPDPPGGPGAPVLATVARPHGDVTPSDGEGAGRASARAASGHATPTPPDDGLRVPGSGGDTPEGSGFVSFTPSPNYARDHEV